MKVGLVVPQFGIKATKENLDLIHIDCCFLYWTKVAGSVKLILLALYIPNPLILYFTVFNSI